MSDLKRVEGSSGYLRLMHLRPLEIEEFNGCREAIEDMISLSKSVALLHGDMPVSLQGFYEFMPGILQVWAIPSTNIHIHLKEYIRVYRDLMQIYFEEDSKIRRVQTWSVDDDLHNRWMEHVGFECEGTMKNFSHTGRDYKMWAVVK